MMKIKFSHNYFKMPLLVEIRKTFIISVSKLHFNELPKGFIEYDTLYAIGDTLEHYELPKTDLIIISLFTESDTSPKVWTTIRRYTPQKFKYYSSLVGKQIEVIIEVKEARG